MDDNGGKSGLNQTDKDLCGLLLLVNHRIRNAGSMLFWVLVVASLFLCVSIHMRWFDSLLGVSVDRLRNFGVYVLIAGIAFVAIILTAHLRESMVYRAKRTEILSRLRKNKLSIEALLAEIANDDNLKQIRNKMMHDKDIQQEAGGYRR